MTTETEQQQVDELDLHVRVARMEGAYEHLATKADVQAIRADMQAMKADIIRMVLLTMVVLVVTMFIGFGSLAFALVQFVRP